MERRSFLNINLNLINSIQPQTLNFALLILVTVKTVQKSNLFQNVLLQVCFLNKDFVYLCNTSHFCVEELFLHIQRWNQYVRWVLIYSLDGNQKQSPQSVFICLSWRNLEEKKKLTYSICCQKVVNEFVVNILPA